jgi:asparagine synthase (glutamine-hydrolysing)
MCGIAGVIGIRGTDAQNAVTKMLGCLVHRGPDDHGVSAFRSAALGARRLAIIDLERGGQPVTNEDGTICAVQNGEIYNFQDLRQQLLARGHTFRSRGDTEVLPHAYEEWGRDFVDRLHGMFALAVWDDRRGSLLLARDRYGKKPLVYAKDGSRVAFASEIQGLLAASQADRTVDPSALRQYLGVGYVPAPHTAFAGIAKVRPAHVLEFSDGSVNSRRYWQLALTPKIEISLDDAVERLRQEIDVAVRSRLMSDVPIGAFLSGGLDSSTVVAFMAKHSSAPVKTFSIGFRDQGLNELPHARRVADAFATDHHELVVDAADTGVLPMLVRNLGEPFADSSIVPTYHVARITRQQVTVALTGDGGDEAFAGYDRYRAVMLAERIGRLPWAARRLGAAIARALPPDRAGRRVGQARRFAEPLALPWDQRYLRWMGYFIGPDLDRIAGERLRQSTAADPASEIREGAELGGSCDPVERVIAADIHTYLPGDLLVKMDIASMAASLEARSPFLDHELTAFVASLPRSYKVANGLSKIVLRRAMRGVLPDETLKRTKRGFGVPLAAWLQGPLRQLVHDAVLRPSADSGLVNRARASELYRELIDGRRRNAPLLWNLLMLELWHRECVVA